MSLISLEQAHAHLNMDNPSEGDDAELQRFIDAAVGAMEQSTRLVIDPREVVETHTVPLSGVIVLRSAPVLAVTGVRSLASGDAVDVDDMVTRLDVGTFLAPVVGDIEVTYMAGMTDPPARYVVAGLIIVAHLWQTQRVPLSGRRVFGGGADNGSLEMGAGWAIPRAASDLLDAAAPLLP